MGKNIGILSKILLNFREMPVNHLTNRQKSITLIIVIWVPEHWEMKRFQTQHLPGEENRIICPKR